MSRRKVGQPSSKDYVAGAIARFMGVSEHSISTWRVESAREHYGQVRNQLVFELKGSNTEAYSLQALLSEGSKSSLVVFAVEAGPSVLGVYYNLTVSMHMVYGKETQHIFKALHQQMTVRGPRRKK